MVAGRRIDETSDLSSFQTLHQIVAAARENLSGNIWDYLIGGSETETTIRRNRLALDTLAFRPSVLRDMSDIQPGGNFLGKPTRLPLILAPAGSLSSIYPDGGAAAARAASSFGVPLFVSIVSDHMLEEVAAAAPARRVLQLYVRGDDAWIDERVDRGVAAGYEAVCLTVDTAVPSRRERDIAKNFVKPWRAQSGQRNYQASFTWADLQRLFERRDVTFILKGISKADDARRACDAGVHTIYVSNHGGRQLDHGRGSMDVLPEIVAAVAGRAKVIVDGGFCRGTDIVKALAIGADAVGIGRIYLYGLAAAGAAGVLRVLEILEQEVIACLGLLGVNSIAELDESFVCPAPPVTLPGIHSSFPLLLEQLAGDGQSAPDDG